LNIQNVLNFILPIDLGFAKIAMDLTNDYGKLILANSITLNPSTLSINAAENHIYIHWIAVQGNSNESRQENVCKSFEAILEW